MMLAPAPDAAMLGHVPIRRPTVSTSNIKQTMVPILMTVGVLLIIFGTLKFMLGPDSPYASLPTWLVGTVFGAGFLLIGLGVLTAFQVKAELERTAAKKK